MANICSNILYISGNKEDIATLTKKITKQNKKLIKLFCWFEKTEGDYGLWKDSLQTDDESISFEFGSKWSFPSEEFDSLVAAYPRLNFEASWEEPAMDNFGKVSNTEYSFLTPLEYYSEFNPDFFEECQQIENLPYDKFLEYVENFNVDDDFFYSYLEPLIIERIERKDLPLFIEKEWIHCQEEFTQKLKGE